MALPKKIIVNALSPEKKLMLPSLKITKLSTVKLTFFK